MNSVKMTAIQEPVSGTFVRIEAEAEQVGIFDDDNEVMVYEDVPKFRIRLAGVTNDPILISGGNLADNLEGSEIQFAIEVSDQEGNSKTYIPGIDGAKVIWTEDK